MAKTFIAIFDNDENSFPLQITNEPDKSLVNVIPDDDEDLMEQVYFIELPEYKRSLAKQIVSFTEDWHQMFGSPDNIAELVMFLLHELEVTEIPNLE